MRSRRGDDAAVAELLPVGKAALRDLLCRHIDEGLSKFVLRPLGLAGSWTEELGWLADAVLDLQT